MITDARDTLKVFFPIVLAAKRQTRFQSPAAARHAAFEDTTLEFQKGRAPGEAAAKNGQQHLVPRLDLPGLEGFGQPHGHR